MHFNRLARKVVAFISAAAILATGFSEISSTHIYADDSIYKNVELNTSSDASEVIQTVGDTRRSDDVWECSEDVDDVTVKAEAPEGVFPDDAVLDVKKIESEADQEKIVSAIENNTGSEVEDTIALDIRILDKEGNELQPDTSAGEVHVSFSRINLDVNNDTELKVFHLNDNLNKAENMHADVDSAEKSAEITAEHFSPYTIATLSSGAVTSYNIESGDVTITQSGDYRIYGTGTECDHKISISGKITANVTLENVNINQLKGGYLKKVAFEAINGADVTVKLSGNNRLVGGYNQAGMKVEQGNKLTITSVSGDGSTDGSLYAYGAGTGGQSGGAGIGSEGEDYGGNSKEVAYAAGDITINGGTIEAVGSDGGAGIGGTTGTTIGTTIGAGGSVTINGGKVNAYSEQTTPNATGGAGIGGGEGGYLSSITITGGDVTARGSYDGAGIGTGISPINDAALSCGEISITGGKVSATGGGDDAASIGYGGGTNFTGGSVSITGGDINLNGGSIRPTPSGYYNMNIRIYDGRITSGNADVSVTLGIGDDAKTVTGSWKGSMYEADVTALLITSATGTQKLTVTNGQYVYTTEITVGTTDVEIGDELIPLNLMLYATDIANGGSYSAADWSVTETGGKTLNSSDTSKVVNMITPCTVSVNSAQRGKMCVYLPKGTYNISCKVSGLNSGNAITVNGVGHNQAGDCVFYNDTGLNVQNEFDIANGPVKFYKDASGNAVITYYDSGKVLQTCSQADAGSDYTIIQSGTGDTENSITVNGWSNAKIHLKGVNIKITDSDAENFNYKNCSGMVIDGNSSVDLILDEGTINKIQTGLSEYAAVLVTEGSTLTIDGNGILNAYGAYIGCGIGNNFQPAVAESQSETNMGSIVINSGTVNVSNIGESGWGIGIGSEYSETGSITINGGTVNAVKQGTDELNYGLGIPKKTSSGDAITINGGNVDMQQARRNSIIAVGSEVIRITGGTVKAGDFEPTEEVGSTCGKVIITGGSITGSIPTRPTNGTVPVYKTTVDLSLSYPAAETEIADTDELSVSAYNIKGIKTDSSKKVYLYLPVSSGTTTGTFAGRKYSGTIAANDENELKRDISVVSADLVSTEYNGASFNVKTDCDATLYYALSSSALTTGEAVASASAAKNIQTGKNAVTVCTIDGLESSKQYTAYFAAYGDGVYSPVKSVEFTTASPALKLSDDSSVSASGIYGMSLDKLPVSMNGSVVSTDGSEVKGTWSFQGTQTSGGSSADSSAVYPAVNGTTGYTAVFTPESNASYSNTLTAPVIPKMENLTVPSGIAASLSANNKSSKGSDWYVGDVTVNAPAGYLISKNNKVSDAGWENSFVVTADHKGDLIYYLRNNGATTAENGGITAPMAISVNRDTVKPVFNDVTYKQGTGSSIVNIWDWVIGKEVITVSVPINESDSGLDLSDINVKLNKSEECSITGTPKAGGVKLDGDKKSGYTLSFTIPDEFIGTYSVEIKDVAGNAADTLNAPVNGRTVVDTKAPAIELTTSGTNFSEDNKKLFDESAVVNISVSDDETSSGIASVSWSDNGGTVNKLNVSGFAANKNTNFKDNSSVNITGTGTHTVKVTAKDHAGNETSKSVTFKIYNVVSPAISQSSQTVYDGKAIAEGEDFILDRDGSSGMVSYSYRKIGSQGSFMNGLPTDAGIYDICAVLAQDDINCKEQASANGIIAIGQAVPVYSVAAQDVRDGSSLNRIKTESDATGVNGEKIPGKLVWSESQSGAELSTYIFTGSIGSTKTLFWTFFPSSENSNYKQTSGLSQFTFSDRFVPLVSLNDMTAIYDGTEITSNSVIGESSYNNKNVPGTFSFDDGTPVMKNAGTYTAHILFTPLDTVEYAPVKKDIVVTINKREINIGVGFSAANVEQGASLPNVSLTYSGLVSGESLKSSVTPVFSGMPGDSSTSGTYNVTWSNMAEMKTEIDALPAASNYNIKYAEAAVFIIQSKAEHDSDKAAGNGTGSTAGNGTGSTAGNGTGSTAGNGTGSTAGNGTGSTAGNGTGSTAGNGTGSTAGNGTGSTAGNGTGSTAGNGTGSTAGNGTGSTAGNRTGSTAGNVMKNRTAQQTITKSLPDEKQNLYGAAKDDRENAADNKKTQTQTVTNADEGSTMMPKESSAGNRSDVSGNGKDTIKMQSRSNPRMVRFLMLAAAMIILLCSVVTLEVVIKKKNRKK